MLVLALFRPAVTIAAGEAASGPAENRSIQPLFAYSLKNDVSPPLADIGPITPEPRELRTVHRGQRPTLPSGTAGPSAGRDRVAQSGPVSNAISAPSRTFDGVNNVDGALPPDTNGDIGPNHYVQWVNLSFAVYDRAGTRLYGPAKGNTLWSGFGGLCQTTNQGDPIVLYDHLADRWFFSQFAFDVISGAPAPPFYQCIAVSKTGDPLGPYFRYAFLISNTKLNDYPKFGVWPDAYYMSINQFTGSTFAGAGAVAFERDKMLLGQTARMVYFDLFAANPNFGGMLPADLDGPPPPANAPNLFVEMDDTAFGFPTDRLSMWEFHVDWSNTANSTFGLSGQPNLVIDTNSSPPLAAFDANMCNFSANCIPQPLPPGGTIQRLDALSDRLMYRLQYRNFGSYRTLVTNHTVDVDGTDHAGVRWYELRDGGGGWSINQQGTYAPDSDHRWMASVAMNGAGHMALGFSISGNSTFPWVRYTGRVSGDSAGTMPQGEGVLVAGAGAQTHSTGRWGDYSMMAVDPLDDSTFWYTQEYYAATSAGGWRTRIGSFRVTSTATSANLSLSKSDSPDPVSVGGDLAYTVTATNTGGSPATGVKLVDTLPGTAAFVSASPSQGSCSGTTTLTCDLGTLAGGASATVTIHVTPSEAGSIFNTASVVANEDDPNVANNTQTIATSVSPSADLSLVKLDSPDPVVVGQPLVYTVTATNSGPSAATGVTVTDTLPATVTFNSASTSQGSCTQSSGTVTCNLGTISSGSNAQVTITVTPNQAGTITNTVNGSATESDPNPANNTASATTTVKLSADLALVKTDSPDPVSVGQPLNYTLTVTNTGPSVAGAVTLTDTLPATVTFNSASPSQGSCTQSSGTVTCNLGTISSGSSVQVTIAVTPNEPGRITNTASVVSDANDPNPANNTANAPTTVKCFPITDGWMAYSPSFTGGVYVAAGDVNGDGCDEIITGAGAGGGPHVRAFRGDGTPIAEVFAYTPSFTGGVRVAAADLDGDGKDELITAPGPGGGPHIRVWKLSGSTFVEQFGFFAYSASFTGGVFVAAGDVTGDGKAEIITGADAGGGPHVRVFSGTGADLGGFFAYASSFTGGVRVAVADIDGGKTEIVTGPGPGGGPRVRVFDGSTFVEKLGFFAYSSTFAGGVFVGGGELVIGNPNGEIVTGAGAGGGPHVQVFSGSGALLFGFFAYDPSFTSGVRVVAADADGDGDGEVVTAPGSGGGPHVRLFE